MSLRYSVLGACAVLTLVVAACDSGSRTQRPEDAEGTVGAGADTGQAGSKVSGSGGTRSNSNGGASSAAGKAGAPAGGTAAVAAVSGIVALVPGGDNGDWVDGATNGVGIQGAFFGYADSSSSLTQRIDGTQICIKGTIAPVPNVDAYGPAHFGAGIGFQLNNQGNASTPYDANANGVTGFRVALGGNVPSGTRISLSDTSTEGTALVHWVWVEASGTYQVYLNGPIYHDVAQASWVRDGQDLTTTELLNVQILVSAVVGESIDYDFCLVGLSALTSKPPEYTPPTANDPGLVTGGGGSGNTGGTGNGTGGTGVITPPMCRELQQSCSIQLGGADNCCQGLNCFYLDSSLTVAGCRMNTGGACASEDDCWERDKCLNGVCTSCITEYSACSSSEGCCEGLECVAGKCKTPCNHDTCGGCTYYGGFAQCWFCNSAGDCDVNF